MAWQQHGGYFSSVEGSHCSKCLLYFTCYLCGQLLPCLHNELRGFLSQEGRDKGVV